jgi:hypothetical protein
VGNSGSVDVWHRGVHRKVHIYLEYNSVCPLLGIRTPLPLSRKLVCSVPHPLQTKGGGTHSQGVEGMGESQFGRLEKKLSTLYTLWNAIYLYSEMEFLDTILTKDSSLLLHDINNLFYWKILKKTTLFSGFKNLYKNNSMNQENSSIFMISIL